MKSGGFVGVFCMPRRDMPMEKNGGLLKIQHVTYDG